MNTNRPLPRTFVALYLSTSAPALISVAKAIVDRMTGNAAVPDPLPALPDVSAAISALDAAETAAQSRAKGTVAARDEKRDALTTMLHQLKASVQRAADANREQARAIIESTGMSAGRTPARPGRVFGATPGAVSGSIRLVAAAATHRAAYDWEYSVDGGQNWRGVPSTMQAKTTLAGLTPGASVAFRYRALTKTGEADWSQPVSIIVR